MENGVDHRSMLCPVVRGDCILLCRRPATDIWVLPRGSPRRSEGAWECARREVSQETGLAITPDRVAFVLDATSLKGEQHLFEIIFSATENDPSAMPRGREDQLAPSFVQLDALRDLVLLPPIGEQLRAFVERSPDRVAETAPYLGNVWGTIPEPGSTAMKSLETGGPLR